MKPRCNERVKSETSVVFTCQLSVQRRVEHQLKNVVLRVLDQRVQTRASILVALGDGGSPGTLEILKFRLSETRILCFSRG